MSAVSDLLDGKDDFLIHTPGCVEILKSDGVDIDKVRPIGGTCSTERLDRQEETVLARGLDFTEFVKYGYYNDNHKQETAAVLGAPRLAELRKSRWYTEGNLICGYAPADRVWELAKALAKSDIPRRLGFSIEGKVVERSVTDSRILRAVIRHVAITNSPVNTDCTWDILAKAFGDRDHVEASAVNNRLGQLITREGLAFNKSVTIIKRVRPHYSWATCERLARILHQQRS